MRRVVSPAALAALCIGVLVPATAVGMGPPTPTMDITACRVDADTVRVGVTWSHLTVTGGEIFINSAPLETEYGAVWNDHGKRGSHTEEIFINGDIVDIVTVNLYNAKDPNNIEFEQRVIGGDGNNAEEIPAC